MQTSAIELSMTLFWPAALAKSQRWTSMSIVGIIKKCQAGISPKGVATTVVRSIPVAVAITRSVIDLKAASPPSGGERSINLEHRTVIELDPGQSSMDEGLNIDILFYQVVHGPLGAWCA